MEVWIAQHGYGRGGGDIAFVIKSDVEQALERFDKYIRSCEPRGYKGRKSIWDSPGGGRHFNTDLDWFAMNHYPVEEH